MAKQLGPTFAAELIAAFAGATPAIAWGGDAGTITGRDGLTPAQLATLDAVLAAHVEPGPLDQAKADQLAAVRAACGRAIVGGFTSAALGAPHVYPSDETSQRNLAGSVLASILPNLGLDWSTPFWCADAAGNWNFAAHTAGQIQQVGLDAKAVVVAAQTRLALLSAEIAAATTAEAIAAVAW